MNVLLAVLLSFFCAQDPQYPPYQEEVADFAKVLSDDSKTKLKQLVVSLRDAKGTCVVVVTTPSLYGMSVEDYTGELFKRWKIGHKKVDDGIIFLVAPTERKCRIETGYGIEATLTDIECGRIIADVIVPYFQAARLEDGIVAGTQAIVAKFGAAPAPTQLPQYASSNSGLDAKTIGIIVLVIIVIFLIIITKGEILFAVLDIAMSSGGGSRGGGGGSSGSSSSGSSSSGGSSGGGGASGSW